MFEWNLEATKRLHSFVQIGERYYQALIKFAWSHLLDATQGNPWPTASSRGSLPPRSSSKIRRNADCPCRSGLKFKRCCIGKGQC